MISKTDKPTETILYKIAVEEKWKLLLPNNVMVVKDASSEKENIAGYYSKDIQLYDLETDPQEAGECCRYVSRGSTAINQ